MFDAKNFKIISNLNVNINTENIIDILDEDFNLGVIFGMIKITEKKDQENQEDQKVDIN